MARVSAFTQPVAFCTKTPLNAVTIGPRAPVFDRVCDTTGVTLKRFMTEVAMLNPELQELTTLFGAIKTACKAISNLVKHSQLPSSETLGYQGEVNVQGEDQKKLDVITNNLLKRALHFTSSSARPVMAEMSNIASLSSSVGYLLRWCNTSCFLSHPAQNLWGILEPPPHL
jgi:hypothetical protein